MQTITSTVNVHRYKLSVNRKDKRYPALMKRIKEVIGQFMFSGDEGNTLQGHDATLVVVTVTGRKDDLPSSISGIVRQ
jgi:hypothetical protein